jgi:hypothetical protein
MAAPYKPAQPTTKKLLIDLTHVLVTAAAFVFGVEQRVSLSAPAVTVPNVMRAYESVQGSPLPQEKVRFESLRLGLLPNARFRSALPSVPVVRPT